MRSDEIRWAYVFISTTGGRPPQLTKCTELCKSLKNLFGKYKKKFQSKISATWLNTSKALKGLSGSTLWFCGWGSTINHTPKTMYPTVKVCHDTRWIVHTHFNVNKQLNCISEIIVTVLALQLLCSIWPSDVSMDFEVVKLLQNLVWKDPKLLSDPTPNSPASM